jgi:hypothetical protein
MIYELPLQKFPEGTTDQVVSASIENSSYVFYFQNNVIESTLFLTCYGANKETVLFGSYRCVLNSYINKIDYGFPYLVYFLNSTNNSYNKITFDTLNNGVKMYVKSRA